MHLLWPFSFLGWHELGHNPHHPCPVQRITCHWDWLHQIPQGSATLLQPEKPALTLTEILPCSLGKWAARNQSPGRGLVMLKTPVVLLGSVQVSVRAKEPGTAVSLGKCMPSGLMTGGAPERKYLPSETKARVRDRRAWVLS